MSLSLDEREKRRGYNLNLRAVDRRERGGREKASLSRDMAIIIVYGGTEGNRKRGKALVSARPLGDRDAPRKR